MSDQTKTSLSFILLSDDVDLNPDRLVESYRTLWPSEPPPRPLECDNRSIELALGEDSACVILMPAPYPVDQIEAVSTMAMFEEEEVEAIRSHTRHLIVTLRSTKEPICRATTLTQVTAALLEVFDQAKAVFWSDSENVIPKRVFIEEAKGLPDDYPILIWIDEKVGPTGRKSSSGYTCGLGPLGHMEFEAVNAPMKPYELMTTLGDLAIYVLTSGRIIEDGNTVGRTMRDRSRIIYSDSHFGRQGKVMFVGFQKPWWRVFG